MNEVIHPNHYNKHQIELWNFLDMYWPDDPLLWNAVKYLGRAGEKIGSNETQAQAKKRDLEKAINYINRRIDNLKNQIDVADKAFEDHAKMLQDILKEDCEQAGNGLRMIFLTPIQSRNAMLIDPNVEFLAPIQCSGDYLEKEVCTNDTNCPLGKFPHPGYFSNDCNLWCKGTHLENLEKVQNHLETKKNISEEQILIQHLVEIIRGVLKGKRKNRCSYPFCVVNKSLDAFLDNIGKPCNNKYCIGVCGNYDDYDYALHIDWDRVNEQKYSLYNETDDVIRRLCIINGNRKLSREWQEVFALVIQMENIIKGDYSKINECIYPCCPVEKQIDQRGYCKICNAYCMSTEKSQYRQYKIDWAKFKKSKFYSRDFELKDLDLFELREFIYRKRGKE